MRTAIELKVDLSVVKGTGPHGAITKADVEKAAKAPTSPIPSSPEKAIARTPAAPATEARVRTGEQRPGCQEERRAAMRRVIAAAMTRSKREIPHYYMGTRIDMSRAIIRLRGSQATGDRAAALFSPFIKGHRVGGYRQIPEMNGFWADGAFKAANAVHVGVAISLRQGGLIAPAVHD